MAKKYIVSALALLGFMVMVSFAMNQLLFSELGTTMRVIRPDAVKSADESVPSYAVTDHTTTEPTGMKEGKIKLPAPALRGRMTVEESLEKRRSIRSYRDEALTLAQVSQLLWSAYGISDSTTFTARSLRTAPSAGATYPLELYLMVRNVRGLEPGLYRYHVEGHSLSLYSSGDISRAVADASLGQMMLHDAPASLIYTAIYSRITGRYGDRGAERYLFMDIGHSAQNVYLQATAMGLGTCAVGAFDDERLASVVNPPLEEVILYLMPLGIPK